MGQQTKKDAEFIELCNQYSCAADVAKYLGISERSLFKRRRNVEKRTGATIVFNKHDMITQIAQSRGVPADSWKWAWDKSSDDASIFIVNPNYGRLGYEAALNSALEQIKKHAPKYPRVKHREPTPEGALCVLNLTDWHFGAWGLDRAAEAADKVVSKMLQRTRGYDVEKFIVVVGNDLLHVDNPNYTTTAGTPQIMDGSTWDQAYDAAARCYVGILERLAPLGQVEVILCQGNHDELTSLTLARELKAWFRHTDFTWDISTEPRKYTSWGSNFISFTHGDRIKFTDLPGLAAQEAPELWGQTRDRYIYMGHLHHPIKREYLASKGFPGIVLEWLNSPKPTDDWHLKRGFTGIGGARIFVHLKEDGQDAAFNVKF